MCSYSQHCALHGYKSLYAHPDLKYDITYLHCIWLLVMTIAHDLHTSVVAVSYTLHMHMHKSSDMLNKYSLAVKKCEANQKQDYKRPKLFVLSGIIEVKVAK